MTQLASGFVLMLALFLAGILPVTAQYGDEVPEIPVVGEDGDGLYVPEGYQPPAADLPLDDPDPSPGMDDPGEESGMEEPAPLPAATTDPATAAEDEGSFGIQFDPPVASGTGRIREEAPVEPRLLPAATEEPAGEAIVAEGNADAGKLFEEGTLLFNGKKYPEALACFQKAIELDPANDVYKLALEMVQATIESEKATPSPVPPPETPAPTAEDEAGVQESGVMMLGDKPPERMAPLLPTEPARTEAKKRIRMVNLTLEFAETGAQGKLHFWKGRRCSLEEDDGKIVATLAGGKGFSDMAIGFTVPGKPRKAVVILTHAAGGRARSIYPLRIAVNKDERLDGTYQLATDYREHRFDVTASVVQGINTLRLSVEQATAPYRLRRAVVFLQYEE